jgi:hypothetical protein
MEPEVHIIEKYFQEILHCFAMTNIRCKGGKEIDFLAVNPRTGEKYHVEARVGTSPGFKIRVKDTYTSKGKPHKRGLDYFLREKFNHPHVVDRIHEIFRDDCYSKVLVVWHVQNEEVVSEANRSGLEIWFISEMLFKLIAHGGIKGSRDDFLRTIEFITLLVSSHAFEAEEAIRILGTSKKFQSHVLQFIMDRARKEKMRENADEPKENP